MVAAVNRLAANSNTTTVEQNKVAFAAALTKAADNSKPVSRTPPGIPQSSTPSPDQDIRISTKTRTDIAKKALPRTDIAAIKNGTQTPTAQQLVDHINTLRWVENKGLLPAADAAKFGTLSPTERRFYGATLFELDRVILDQNPGAAKDYMFNVMQHAADISGNDGMLFTNLVHQGFSEPKMDGLREFSRTIAGGGTSTTGQYLEDLYKNYWDNTNSNFNPLVRDTEDLSNTITHHFGEFLAVGASNNIVPQDAVTMADSPKKNPGDVRSGFFAVMVGDALEHHKITPQEAVDLTRWAYSSNHVGKNSPPLWGATEADKKIDDAKAKKVPARFQVPDYGYASPYSGKFKIEDWMAAYRRA